MDCAEIKWKWTACTSFSCQAYVSIVITRRLLNFPPPLCTYTAIRLTVVCAVACMPKSRRTLSSQVKINSHKFMMSVGGDLDGIASNYLSAHTVWGVLSVCRLTRVLFSKECLFNKRKTWTVDAIDTYNFRIFVSMSCRGAWLSTKCAPFNRQEMGNCMKLAEGELETVSIDTNLKPHVATKWMWRLCE